MKLVASAICRNEADRYLGPWLDHLAEFADEIRILDDASTDGTGDILRARIRPGGVALKTLKTPAFDVHEGQARQQLLDWTLEAEPTHVLAVDADEFIGDGIALRVLIEDDPAVAAWRLTMTEIWNATATSLQVRTDGAWRPYERVHLWKVPDAQVARTAYWQIQQRPLACSPIPVGAIRAASQPSEQRIYHFGWADPATRQARYERYMSLDAGKYHARQHLASIIWPPERIRVQDMPWPDATWAQPLREKLVGA